MVSGARDHETVQGFSRSPGDSKQSNITAVANATEITYSEDTIFIMIQNLSGQFIQFSLDDGTTYTDINPYQSISGNFATTTIKIRRKSGSADASVQVVATFGKS